MYYKLNEKEKEKIKKVKEITITDYELLDDFIPVKNMMTIIEDLLMEIDKLEEEKEDCENNKKEDPYYEYGVSERDFI